MSIDPNELTGASRVIKLLNLKEGDVPGIDVVHFLTMIWSAGNRVWSNVEEDQYTIHDVKNHSEKIIRYFMELDALYGWSPRERLVFGAAAIIHDIGMQYHSWAPDPDLFPSLYAELPEPPLTVQQIRELHCELGFELIRLQMKHNLKYPAEFCDLSRSLEVTALSQASIIGFSHSNDEYRNRLINDPNYSARKKHGLIYRPRLLAGVLRLCDELDGNIERVRDPDRVYTWKINNESRVHWLSCIFVEETDIKISTINESTSAQVILRWQVPEGSDEQTVKEIQRFLRRIRLGKINREIIEINQFFQKCDETRDRLTFDDTILSEILFKFNFPLEKELLSLLKQAEAFMHTKPSVIPDQIAGEKESEAETDELLPETEYELRNQPLSVNDALQRWFIENSKTGHFRLINELEHTDVYVNCRTLVSDQNLIRMITNEIYHKVPQNIDCILAVGTSAIPIATNLAFRLGCSVTYTFFSEGNRYYNKVEVSPSVEEGQIVLIIDDVISGGTVISKIIDQLVKNNKTPSVIYHYALFRLGNRNYKSDKRVRQYLSIVHVPDVCYYTSVSDCPMCLREEPFLDEAEDMIW